MCKKHKKRLGLKSVFAVYEALIFCLLLCLSTGQYNIPAGIVFSMPVRFQDGKWSVLPDVTIGDELRAKLQLIADQLRVVSNTQKQQHSQGVSQLY